MEVIDLVKKLKHSQWFEQDLDKVLTNPYGNEAAMNIAWVLNGKPKNFTPAFFNHNWHTAARIIQETVEHYPVREWATLLSIEEFSSLIQRNPSVFSKYLPMAKWNKIMCK